MVPRPLNPRRLLTLSAPPWLPTILPSRSFRRRSETSVPTFSGICLPANVSSTSGCRRARSLFSSALMQAGPGEGRGARQARGTERALALLPRKPRPGAFAGGVASLPPPGLSPLPYPVALRQHRNRVRGWRAGPPPEFPPGTGGGGGGGSASRTPPGGPSAAP